MMDTLATRNTTFCMSCGEEFSTTDMVSSVSACALCSDDRKKGRLTSEPMTDAFMNILRRSRAAVTASPIPGSKESRRAVLARTDGLLDPESANNSRAPGALARKGSRTSTAPPRTASLPQVSFTDGFRESRTGSKEGLRLSFNDARTGSKDSVASRREEKLGSKESVLSKSSSQRREGRLGSKESLSALPTIKSVKFNEETTGDSLLDYILGKLHKPKLREALDRMVRDVSAQNGSKAGAKPINGVTAVFKDFDENGDGVLSRDEIAAGLRRLGVSLLPSELDAVMRAFDFDMNGTVDTEEFAQTLELYRSHFVAAEEVENEPFPVGSKVLARFRVRDMSQTGTVVSKGEASGTYLVQFKGAQQPLVVKANQIKGV